MMTMMIRSQEHSRNHMVPITTSICPTWKLYENPFYYISQSLHQQEKNQSPEDHHPNQEQIHHLHLPVSARKIASSFWDLTFIKPLMESELQVARAHIVRLKAELECERKARKKVESLNKRLAQQLSEEREGVQALERVCEDLAKQVSLDKAQFDRMNKEMEQERKMLRVSEVIREERLQMKLADAKILLEEKLLELEETKINQPSNSNKLSKNQENNTTDQYHQIITTTSTVDGHRLKALDKIRLVDVDKQGRDNNNNSTDDNNNDDGKLVEQSMIIKGRAYPEPENPHIKRGIKGLVEFPRVVQAIGCRRKHLGSKLESQKAQLNALLKHKGPIRFNGLIAS